MASVFLSYDHRDGAKARIVADALEKAGHQVWWDRHIEGGAQYSREIEQALDAADAVVVLWSVRSIDSEWVRDEAAAGKARQRLVPARIDNAEPPLGFRQYQVVDLASWRGSRRSPALQQLLRAIVRCAEGTAAESAEPVPGRQPSGRPVAIAVVIAALALITAGLAYRLPWNRTAAPVVTVTAMDSNPASVSLAQGLFVQLGSLKPGAADSLELIEPADSDRADYTFKVGGRLSGNRMIAASVSLIGGQGQRLLWSKEFAQADGNEADLRQQIAYSIGKVLACAAETSSGNQPRIGPATVRLYLDGCADLSDLSLEQPTLLVRTFRKVTEQAPQFTGGWAKLLLAETEAFRQTGLSDPALRASLSDDITTARRLYPGIVEADLAEAWMQAPRPIIGWMRFVDISLRKDPDHPDALIHSATGLFHVGRLREAVALSRHAVQVDPLSPTARDGLISAHLEAGETQAARNALNEAERIWPGATTVVGLKFAVEFRQGDPRKALEIARSGRLPSVFTFPPAYQSYLTARIERTPATISRALADARAQFAHRRTGLPHLVQTLAEFDRHEELVKTLTEVDPTIQPGLIAILFRPPFARLHADRRFMIIAKRFGLIDYWRQSGKWPDFCSRPDLPYDCKGEAARLTGAAR